MHAGIAKIGEVELELNEHHQTSDSPVVAYVKPHDIEILRESDGASSFEAKINYIHAVGPIVRMELERSDSNTFIEAELTRERFDNLQLREGEKVYLKPHNLRVFIES